VGTSTSGSPKLRSWDLQKVATVAGLLVAIATAVIAYLAFRTQPKSPSQAEQVSAAVIAPGELGTESARIGLFNHSDHPVTRAIVTQVYVGNGPKSASEYPNQELLRDYQRELIEIPPGESEVRLQGLIVPNTLAPQPGVEVAFIDQGGAYWLRRANGTLTRIKEAPESYYHLVEPLPWESARPLEHR
jgi:hypothetical protein